MKLVLLGVLLTIASMGLVSSDKQPGKELKAAVGTINDLQVSHGGTGSNVNRILDHILNVLKPANGKQSLFIAGDDGKVYSGGLLGNLIGGLLATVGYILGGDNGLCGGAHGLYMQQHQGLMGKLLDTLGPILGPLGNGGGPDADNGAVSDILKHLGLLQE